MNIFIPAYNDPNPYLDQIVSHSKHHYVFKHYTRYSKKYEVVNVHWPEAIFGWKEPTKKDLDLLEREIQMWKKHSKLIYTRHDARRHEGMTPTYQNLFRIIEENADGFIHLGLVSQKQMQEKFPSAVHSIIFHPLYEKAYRPVEKTIAREKLKIQQNSLVVMASGRIRSKAERDMVLKGFNSLPAKNKVLLSNNMLPFRYNLEFPGRVKLKKLVDVNKLLSRLVVKNYQPPKYLFHYGFSKPEDLAIMMSAADIVFIPRIDILNSGNIYLGLTFRKVVVGPSVENLEEQLKKFNFPLFDPHSAGSVKRALSNGVALARGETFAIDEDLLEELVPAKISSQIDQFFENLV